MTDISLLKMSDTGNIVKNFLQSSLKQIMSVVGADGGSLFMFDHEHKELVLASFFNSKQLNIEGLRKRIGDGVCGKVAELKMPVLVNNINQDARFIANGFKHYRTNSFMSIPLEGPFGLIGLVNIVDKKDGQPFTEKDLEFSVILAKYACIIIEYLLHSTRLDREKTDLSKQKEMLEKYASVGKLAAGVVHEINNPLDGIIRFTNIVLDQIDTQAVSKDYLIEIKKGLKCIANITNSLLEFSRQLNSYCFEFKRYVDIHNLIDESIDMLKNKIKPDIAINRFYNNSSLNVLDLGLRHVFINIIKNALDAMPQGGSIDIHTNRSDSLLEICFQDTGTGIHKDIMERIFEPFFTTKTREKGTGLGLAMCREIMNRYDGGSIKVDSREGQGSTFSILIPIKHLKNE
jgi:signal transduction histidine kinase